MLSIKEKSVKTVQRCSRCQGGRRERREEMKVEICFKLKSYNNKRDRLYQRLEKSDTDP